MCVIVSYSTLDLQSSLALDKGSNFTPSSARQEAKKELACYKTRQRQQNQIARILMDPNLSLVRSVSPLKNWQQKNDWCIKGKSEWLMRWGILPFVTLFKSMNELAFCHVAWLSRVCLRFASCHREHFASFWINFGTLHNVLTSQFLFT